MASPTGLTLYTAGTPNGYKVTVLLEELGLAYEVSKHYCSASRSKCSTASHVLQKNADQI